MLRMSWITGALAACALGLSAAPARAEPALRVAAEPAQTLTLGLSGAADTTLVHRRWHGHSHYGYGHHHGYGHQRYGFYGYPRGYSHGWAPRYGFSFNYSRGYYPGYYNRGYYSSYYYPRSSWSFGYSYRPSYYYAPPAYYYQYSTPYYYCPMHGATMPYATTLGTMPSAPVVPTPLTPMPPAPSNGTYPYNGGPVIPVPLPPVEAEPSAAPPSVPTDGRVVTLPLKQPTKYTYAAYGETPGRTSPAAERVVTAKTTPAQQTRR